MKYVLCYCGNSQTDDKNVIFNFNLPKGATAVKVSMGPGSVFGNGANVLLLDDVSLLFASPKIKSLSYVAGSTLLPKCILSKNL